VRKKRRKSKHVDYGALYDMLCGGPLNYAKIREVTGVSNSGIMQIIDGLSLRYPLYQIRKGVYGLLKDDDDDDGKKAGEEGAGRETRRG
jgi:hypothetical protein